jgi:hypothetical protein
MMPRTTTSVPAYVYILIGAAGALVVIAWAAIAIRVLVS